MRTEVEFAPLDREAFSKFKDSQINAHRRSVTQIQWNSIGNKLASSFQINLRIWNYDDITTLTRSTDLKSSHQGFIDSIRWKDATILLTVSKQSFKIWDIRDNKQIRSQKNEKKTKPDFVQGQWMPNSNTFAISSKDNIINFYDTRKQGVVQNLKFQNEIDKFHWDHYASALFVAVWENSIGSIQVRQCIQAYPVVETISCHPGKLTTFEIDSSNKYLATGGQDATINLYELQQMLCIRTYHKTDGAIKSLSFSPNSKFLICTSQQSYIDIYNVQTGKHSFRSQNYNGISYKSATWHPKKDVIAIIEDEDKGKKSDDGKIKLLHRRADRSPQ